MGLLDRLKQRLFRTRTALSDQISALFRGGRPIDEGLLEDLEAMLYGADLGQAATEICAELARLHGRGELTGEQDVREVLWNELYLRLSQDAGEPGLEARPTVLLVVGVNGSGKTTTIAQLAHRYRERGLSVLLGACDTFRAAAADQLEVWAGRAGAEIVRRDEGADPASVAFDTVDTALNRGIDVVILDTAGRLHTQKNLMEELRKVHRVVTKRLPGAPHEVLLVLDGTNGQNAIQQAREFTAAVEVTGLVIAKLDGTARGGAVFGIKSALELPIRYIGTGESMELLEVFEPEAFVNAVLR
jgi:fused signal recognition particle receptor